MKTPSMTGFGFKAIKEEGQDGKSPPRVSPPVKGGTSNRVSLVVVKWWDAAASGSGTAWTPASDVAPPGVPTLSVGFVWYQGEEFITLVATIDDSVEQDEVSGVMHIPVGTIIGMKTLGYMDLGGGEDDREEPDPEDNIVVEDISE